MNLCNTDTPQGLDGFGARLRIIRDIRNLTQQEVAEKSGLVAAHVSHFETGERLPSLENLRVLCKALNVSADYLIDSDECVTTQIDEVNAFVKHVGAPNFKEAVDVLFRTKEQDEEKIEGMFNKLKGISRAAIPALQAAYARGHSCDLGEKCPGCMAGYALEAITGRPWTQEECEALEREKSEQKQGGEYRPEDWDE